jgi:hypothetical protein
MVSAVKTLGAPLSRCHLEIRIVVAGFAETWECSRGALRGMMTNHSVVGSTLAILYAVSIHPGPMTVCCRPICSGNPRDETCLSKQANLVIVRESCTRSNQACFLCF